MTLARVAVVLLAALPAMADVQLQIQHSVIKKILKEQVFTDDGRKYVKANRLARCSYAYLEDPDIGEDHGRLKIRALFSGRSGRNFFGQCIGLGDSFRLAIFAMPYYRDGSVYLKDVSIVSEDKDGIYIRGVRVALADTLTKQFSYRIVDDAKKLLEQTPAKAAFHQELVSFGVSQMRVTQDAIVLTLDFVLAVK